MNNLKDILLEKLKVSKNPKGMEYYQIDVLEPGSREKAKAILLILKDRYSWLFDEKDISILRSNNIQLGRFKDEYNTGKYGGYKFTLDLNQPEYAIKRKYLWKSYSGVFTEVEGFSTLEETLNAFDEKLRKYGYLKEE